MRSIGKTATEIPCGTFNPDGNGLDQTDADVVTGIRVNNFDSLLVAAVLANFLVDFGDIIEIGRATGRERE